MARVSLNGAGGSTERALCWGVPQLGRSLIVIGVVVALIGVAVVLGQKLGLGRLPGDISIERKGYSLHFPLVTSILISVVLTVLANLFLNRR